MKTRRLSAGLIAHPALHTSLLLLILFVAIYCLTYSGTFLTDDEHILASRTLSLSFDDHINDSRVYGNTRVFALANLSPEQAAQALNIEPLQGLAGLPLAWLAAILHLGLVQTIFLLNIWVVALTAVVLFSIVMMMGFSRQTALVISLLFGLGTQVWAYSRTYFRDPLAMLCLLLAWACAQKIIINFKQHKSSGKSWFAWVGLIVFLIAGALAKNTVTIAIPVLLVEIIINNGWLATLFHYFKNKPDGSRKKLLFVIQIILILLVFWLIVLPRLDILARFTPAYYYSLVRFFFTTPHPNLLQALAGPFISPNKSIFLYSPILILSIIALFRHPRTSWSAWLYLCLLIFAQALFYDGDWWGHRNWGLRFILPAIPPLIITAAPVLENWLPGIWHRMEFIFISVVSVLVQVISILPSMRNYYVDIANSNPSISEYAAIWIAKYSPILWHMNWILNGKPFDLAAVRTGVSSIPVVLGFAFIILLVVMGLTREKWHWLTPAAMAAVTSLMVLMISVFSKDPAYFPFRKDLETAQENLSQQYKPGDLVLIKTYGSPSWYYWMNWSDPQVPWTSLPYYFPKPDLISSYQQTHDPEPAMDVTTLSLLRTLPGLYRRVWLVLPGDTPGSDLDLEATWLDSNSASVNVWIFPGDGVVTRLFLFQLPVQSD